MTTSFLQQPLLTCIGNKRKLIEPIIAVVREVAAKLGKERLRLVDACTGSGVVARHLLPLAEVLYINDLEHYSYVMARSIFERPSEEQKVELTRHFAEMVRIAEEGPYKEEIISHHYAPRDTVNIKEGERCFYTRENALRIDTMREYISLEVPVELQHWCIAPLLVKASINVNTSGLFKGYHKRDGIGCFGGKGGDALGRITKPILTELPIWSEEKVEIHCSQEEILTLLDQLPNDIDLVYVDPPYVSAPYGSNYFMLNTISTMKIASSLSRVSGIPADWNRSAFNYHNSAIQAMKEVLCKGLQKARYVLISYNDEGLITPGEWYELLSSYQVEKREIKYEAYKGCRNRSSRDNEVTELMYLVSYI